MPVNQVKSMLTRYCPPGGQEQFKTSCSKERGVWIMKKKIYIIGVMTVLAITCFGCGKKDAATDRKVAEATTEITTETTEKVTEQSDKKKTEKTTEATTEKVSEDKKSEKSDKKSDTKKSDKKSGATTQAAATQPANESKPVVTTTTNSNSSTGSNTSANNTSQTTDNKSQTSSKPQTTECQHNWVHVDAVMGERCVKPAVTAHWYCRNCQKYMISVNDDPCNGANGSTASYDLEPAVFETYEVSPAYDYCSKCGIRK